MECRRPVPEYRSLVLWVSAARTSSVLVLGPLVSVAKETKLRHHRPRHIPRTDLSCCSSLGNQTYFLHIHLHHRRLHHCMPRIRQTLHCQSLHTGCHRKCHRSSHHPRRLQIYCGWTLLFSVQLECVRHLLAARRAPSIDYARLHPDLCRFGQ